jgi:hypothetical protein
MFADMFCNGHLNPPNNASNPSGKSIFGLVLFKLYALLYIRQHIKHRDIAPGAIWPDTSIIFFWQ